MAKKLLSVLLSLVLLAGALTGCAGNEELIANPAPAGESAEGAAPAGAESPAGGGADLVFLRAGTDEEGRAFWTWVIDEYTGQNPGVSIEYQEAPWGNDIETKLNTAFASQTAPDVLSFNIASLGQRVPLGQYEPLDAYFDAWEGKDDLMESMKQMGMVGDTLYGMTYGPNPQVFTWRQDLFEAAGLDPETPPQSWEQLLEYHEKLTVVEGGQVVQSGLAMPTTGTNSYQFYQTFAMQNGIPNFIDEVTDELLFHSDAGRGALEFIQRVAEIGYLSFNQDNSDNNPYLKGQSAMAYVGVGDYNKAAANEEWGDQVRVSGPIPGEKQDAVFCGANLFYITSQSKYKDISWDFIAFNMAPEILWRNVEELGSPVVRTSMEAEFVQLNPELNAAIVSSVNVGNGVAKVPYVWSVLGSIVTAIEKTILGEADAADALEEAYEAAQAEIDSL